MTTFICNYIRKYIMRTNIFSYMKVYDVIYETMYNMIVCSHYILSYIMRTNISVIHESV